MITTSESKRIENTFWKGVRMRYWKRRAKRHQNENDYDIELLLNTIQILKSEIEQLKKEGE